MAVQKGCFRSARKLLNWQRGNSELLLVERLQSANHPNLDRDAVARSFPAESGSYVRTSHFYAFLQSTGITSELPVIRAQSDGMPPLAGAPAVSKFGGIVLSQCAAARVSLIRGDTNMSVNELQALTQKFADAFDQRDLQPVMEMLSEDVEVFDHVPYRFDGKRSSPSISTRPSRALSQRASASGNHRVACTAIP